MKTTSPELLHLQLQLPSDNLTLSLWLGETDFYFCRPTITFLFLVLNCNSVLCSGISVTVLLSNKAINFVVKSLFIVLLALNILTSLTNISLVVLVSVKFDSVLLRDYQIIFYWSLLTYSTLNYEISRMRYYCAKHAFRIHKFASCYIAAQVGQSSDQVIKL